MSYAQRATASIDRLARHFGDQATITLRRNHTLINGLTHAAVTTLALNGAHSSGATSLNLDGVNLEEGGVLPVGITFTLGGNTYTVATADVRVDGSGELNSVAITPALAGNESDDAVVTLTATYVDHSLPCAVSSYQVQDVGDDVDLTDRKIIVSLLGASVSFNAETDAALLGTEALTVKNVERFKPGTVEAGLILQVAA